MTEWRVMPSGPVPYTRGHYGAGAAAEEPVVSVEPTDIEGLFVVRFPQHDDERGWFRQTHQVGELEAAIGRELRFRQGNHSRSLPGVLRGFHAEPWDKLVQVTRGTVFAAVADVRPASPTFGLAAAFLLGDPPGERMRLFVGEGLANAFCVVGTEPADYLYDVTEEWSPDASRLGIAWDDPDLAVPWPLGTPVVSSADRDHPTLREHFGGAPRPPDAGGSLGRDR